MATKVEHNPNTRTWRAVQVTCLTKVLAIDPGPTKTGWVLFDMEMGLPLELGVDQNTDFEKIAEKFSKDTDTIIVVEKPALIGQHIWYQILDTCIWIGELKRLFKGKEFHYITRQEVKKYLLGKSNVKGADKHIRQKLLDRFPGGQGTKKKPGPLYGFKADAWAALAVAITWSDNNKDKYVK